MPKAKLNCVSAYMLQIKVGKSLCLQKPYLSVKAILTDKLFHSAETRLFFIYSIKKTRHVLYFSV